MLHSTAAANLRERAYRYIRNAVITRALLPGCKIDPKDAAELTGAPLAIMREILTDLVEEGWLEQLSPEIFTVKPVTGDDIRKTAQHRLPLEFLIIEYAMPRLTRRQFEYLDALISQHRRAELAQCHVRELLSLDQSFHLYLASLTGNARLVESMRSILEINMRLGVDASRLRGRSLSCLHEHEAVVNALREADCAAAKKAMRLHVDNTYNAMLLSVEDPQS